MNSSLKFLAGILTFTCVARGGETGVLKPEPPNDPFADLDVRRSSKTLPPPATLNEQSQSPMAGIAGGLNGGPAPSFLGRLFGEGFSFKKEIMLELSRSSEAAAAPDATADGLYSRNSIGFEMLKKFSTDTATVAAFDVQIRLVRRDNFHEVVNDMEGENRRGWFLEYHNFYWDFYNVFNPLFDDEGRGGNAGRFNFRVGRFYLPFGLNLQTGTHGTLLQLSNEMNFGFERDWQAGFWGSINADLNYDCYYLLGSGYDAAFEGQSGLAGARVSLSNKYLNDYGIEGGLSFLGGQRFSQDMAGHGMMAAMHSHGGGIIDTLRFGGDLRWRHSIPTGSITLMSELSAGRDERDEVITQLCEADYLTLNRRFGASLQYRRFHQDRQQSMLMPGENSGKADAAIIGELTWYFRNDLGNANLHWIKLCVAQATESRSGGSDSSITLQYYRYW